MYLPPGKYVGAKRKTAVVAKYLIVARLQHCYCTHEIYNGVSQPSYITRLDPELTMATD